MSKYLTGAETAALLRRALHESFPTAKFSVRMRSHSSGASASVRWTDGPSLDQVVAVANVFRGSFFDSDQDLRRSTFRMLRGERVNFALDHITVVREYTDEAVQLAIDAVHAKYAGNFSRDGLAKPTVADYRGDALWRVQLTGLHLEHFQNVGSDVRAWLAVHSQCETPSSSATLASVLPDQPAGAGEGEGEGDKHAGS